MQGNPGSSTTDTLVSFSKRGDLLISKGEVDGQPVWTVKDPISLSYFQMGAVEFALFNQLNGRPQHISNLLEGVMRQVPGGELSEKNAGQFLFQLMHSGLVRSNSVGQTKRVQRIQKRRQSGQRLSRIMGILSTRFRGINPRRLLIAIEPVTRRLLSPLALVAYVVLIVWAIGLVTIRFETLQSRLPTLQQMIAPENLLVIMLAVVVVKLLHELGHAVVCNHLKADCHEFGIMLLVMFPVFYCNVSDSWTLKPARRVAIAAAGIAAELLIASFCTILWWFTAPGPFNALLLNLMVVCSVGTIVFNANPLLRFDGYFMLQDALNIPNLAQNAKQVVRRTSDLVIFGQATDEPVTSNPYRWTFLLTYGLASTAYRLVIGIFILLFLNQVFESIGLKFAFYIFCIPILVGMFVAPAFGFVRRYRRLVTKEENVRSGRVRFGAVAFLAVLSAIVLIPWPYTVTAPCVILPADAQAVYVVVPGRITDSETHWADVKKGDVIARLDNPVIESDFVRLTDRVAELELTLNNLNRRRSGDDSVRFLLPGATSALEGAKERLEQISTERQRLTVTSPCDGVFLPPRSRLADAESGWLGYPTDTENRGAALEATTMLGQIGDPNHLQARVLVPQESIHEIEVGEAATVRLLSATSESAEAKVVTISRSRVEHLPREIVAAGFMTPESAGLSVYYEVQLEIQASQTRIALYSPGKARIECQPRSLAFRAIRAIRQAFRSAE